MKQSEIKKYLKDKNIFANPQVKKLGRGNNYDVYLIKEKEKKYVLRASRIDVITENKLENEFRMLEFLEYLNIDFCQKPVFFDRNNLISILTYAPGKEVGLNELSGKNLEKFVKQLAILHAIKYKDYVKFCRLKKYTPKKPETVYENLYIKGISRFNYIKKHCRDEYYLNWIKPKLNEAVSLIKKKKFTKNNIIFEHGDLGGANIILDGKKVYFIDWEQTKFVYHTDYWLGHVFIRCRTSSKAKQKKITQLYAQLAGKNENSLAEKIRERMKISKLTDVIWATKMFVELKEKGFKNWKKYERECMRRISEYEKEFKS